MYSWLPQRSLPKVINQTRSISIQDSFGKYFELSSSSTIEFKSLTTSDRQPTPQSNFYWNFHTKLCSFPTKTHHYLPTSPPFLSLDWINNFPHFLCITSLFPTKNLFRPPQNANTSISVFESSTKQLHLICTNNIMHYNFQTGLIKTWNHISKLKGKLTV